MKNGNITFHGNSAKPREENSHLELHGVQMCSTIYMKTKLNACRVSW